MAVPRAPLGWGAGAAAVGALAAWPFVEPALFALRRVRVPVLAEGEKPLTVLHLSNLHLLPEQHRKARWVRDLARLEPDLVVSTGDHWSSPLALELLVDVLGALSAQATCAVFVPGNNDYYAPVRPTVRDYVQPLGRGRRHGAPLPWDSAAAALTGAGWLDLTERRTTTVLHGRPVTLTGTDDATLRRDRYARVAGSTQGLALGITHTPARRLLNAFAADGHALVIAGHTHGGQLRVPGMGALVTNCDLPRWRARGLTRDERGWLHVSAGLGSSPYLPVRVACRPEATLLELVPSEISDDGAGGVR